MFVASADVLNLRQCASNRAVRAKTSLFRLVQSCHLLATSRNVGFSSYEATSARRHAMKNDNAQPSFGIRQIRNAPESADELATSLAIMQATLESTTEAILVTDGTNHVTAFNEKFIALWAVPPEIKSSRGANDFTSPAN
jgi:hypothetical protein